MTDLARLPVTPDGPMCRCVRQHAPGPVTLEHHHIWPQGHGGPTVPENLVWLCGTAHNNIHAYLDHMLAGTDPDRRAYSRYVRGLAELGYRRIKAGALVD